MSACTRRSDLRSSLLVSDCSNVYKDVLLPMSLTPNLYNDTLFLFLNAVCSVKGFITNSMLSFVFTRLVVHLTIITPPHYIKIHHVPI